MNTQELQSKIKEIINLIRKSGSPKAVKAAAIAEAVIDSATSMAKYITATYPRKRAFKKSFDRRPAKRMIKARLKATMYIAAYVNAMQIKRIIDQPITEYAKGSV